MTQLYGGAITANLPQGAIDVSDFRQIPDTQEVFLLEKPNGLDQSIIFDLLERVDASSLPEVIAVHLDDILEGAATNIAPLESMEHPVLRCEMHTFLVKPLPSKQETEHVKLFMFLFLIRLEKVATDFLVTMNVPLETNGEVTQELFQKEVSSVMNQDQSIISECYKQVKESAISLDVKDWKLFG
ncbi:CIC11C00000002461 [Sungouiella intermedia]|uniref:CIC11C00000002461 n=1 Tax=Sungouiella intermedia TaxID=45354 RepID=A0A1L0C666_9ASCO|nr:CIC11C00000002461 [[Candida] intermedia]